MVNQHCDMMYQVFCNCDSQHRIPTSFGIIENLRDWRTAIQRTETNPKSFTKKFVTPYYGPYHNPQASTASGSISDYLYVVYWGYSIVIVYKSDHSCPFPNTTSNDSNCRYNSTPAQQSPRFRPNFWLQANDLNIASIWIQNKSSVVRWKVLLSNPGRTVTFSTGST